MNSCLVLTKGNLLKCSQKQCVQASVIVQGRDPRDPGNIEILIQPVLFAKYLTPSPLTQQPFKAVNTKLQHRRKSKISFCDTAFGKRMLEKKCVSVCSCIYTLLRISLYFWMTLNILISLVLTESLNYQTLKTAGSGEGVGGLWRSWVPYMTSLCTWLHVYVPK